MASARYLALLEPGQTLELDTDVEYARDTQDALSRLRTGEFDAVILGLDLAGEDGLESADRVQSLVEIPVIFVSHTTDPVRVRQAARKGSGFVPAQSASYMLESEIESVLQIADLKRKVFEEMQSRRQADVALKQNLALLQDIIDTSTDMIFLKDTELRTIVCNRVFARAIDREPWQTYGKTDIENGWDPELVKGNPAKGIRGFEQDDRAALAGETVHNTSDPANVNGKIHYFDTFKLPMRDAAGRITGVLGISRDITERMHAEEALREAEERYRFAVSGGRVAAWVYSVDTAELRTGGALEHLLGYPPGSLVTTEQWAAVTHPDDLKWMAEQWTAVIEGRQDRYDIEHRMRAQDGSERWMEVRAQPVVENGRVTRIAGTTVDITAEVRERLERQRSERRFRHAIEASPVPTALNDDNGNILYLNPAFVRTFGYELYEIPVLDAWWPRAYPDPEYRQFIERAWAERMNRARETGEAFEPMEVVVRCMDGTQRTVIAAAVTGGSAGDAHPVVLFDITDRKRAEEALAAEKERFRVILESIADAVFTTDTECRVTGMNEAAELLTGVTERHAIGRNIDELVSLQSESGSPTSSRARDAMRQNSPQLRTAPLSLQAPDRTRRLVAESASPLRSSSGEIFGAVLVLRDVTEREKLLEEMQRLEKLDSLGVLAGGIAHDFNNLLTSLFGYIELANAEANPLTQKYLQKALRAFSGARDLTQQLLTFSRGGSPVLKPGSLDSVIRETAAFVLSGSGTACEIHTAPGLWPCDFDPGQITQVFTNLLINARQAMNEGGRIKITIENRVRDTGYLRGRFVEAAVTDEGPGIAPEHLKHIFDPFFTTRAGGSGLGLATSHSIIQRHNGTIDVQSSPGAGTTFRVLLPASEEAPAAENPPDVRAARHARILVMDDEPMIREMLAAMLDALGHTAETAPDGRTAIALCEEALHAGRPFDAAILDLTVPGGMGGQQAAKILREKQPSLVLFASSGYSEDPAVADPASAGFTDSLRKPYTSAQLAELLGRFLA